MTSDEATGATAPAVVAVLVTRDPGPWLEETLAALAAQDYGELSVLVVVAGGQTDPTERVAAVLPEAFIAHREDDRGFGAAANVVLEMVEGAAFYLFCHDDCAADPDAVHLLVEESYRSNAGVVGPKVLQWEDPSILLHVGMNVDKTGAVVERVHAGEVDHGQHDAVRDVFMVPGGFTLVRADLFKELGGFDPGIVAMGEDLELCWRAQVAGARVLVVPDARVRHREALSAGLRPVPVLAGDQGNVSLQDLERRHEMRAALTCYSWSHLVRVVPQIVVLTLGELFVSLVARNRDRARAVIGAWTWNLSHYRDLKQRRAALRAIRALSDHEVRRLQLRGSARLSTYGSRLVHQDFDVAHGRAASTVEGAAGAAPEPEPELTGSVGLAFSEDSDFDELDDLGRRAGRDRFGHRRRRAILGTRRSRLILWMVTAVILLVGTRNLLGGRFPLVGQYLPFPSWTGTWQQWFAGWQPAGLGSTAPVTPAFGVMGVLGTFTLGGMGLLQKILVLGCIPLGAWGISRLLRPLCTPRGRIVGAIAYVALPLGYDALAQGRWDGLVAYGTLPWILAALLRSSGMPPFERNDAASDEGVESGVVTVEGGHFGVGEHLHMPTYARSVLFIGVIDAAATAFAPSVCVVVLVCAAGLMLGSLAVGQRRGCLRIASVTAGATVLTAILCLPWLVGTLLAGHGAMSIFGLAGTPASAVGWSGLLRFAVGPVGSSPLSWFLVATAFLPVLIGRGERLAWAGRLWTLACCSWFLGLAVSRGWTGSFAPTLEVVLAPAAVAVAAGVGLGVAAFERDLPEYRFGWRQILAGLAAAFGLLGVVPVVVAAGGGRWDLVSNGYAQTLAFTSGAGSASGAGLAQGAGSTSTLTQYRVLWLGDPSSLPTAGWSVSPGLAYATSVGGTPGPTNIWAPAGPGPATVLADAVDLTMAGRTTHLGRLLAPAAVRYVVVVGSFAPQITGVQEPPISAVPAGLLPSLQDQADLVELSSEANGFSVFENTAVMPQRAERAHRISTHQVAASLADVRPTASDIIGWHSVLPRTGTSAAPSLYRGQLLRGTVFASLSPAGRWHVDVDGREVPQSPAFGWAAQYAIASAGTGSLSFQNDPLVFLATLAELLLWLVIALFLLRRPYWLAFWRPLTRGGRWVWRRSGRRGAGTPQGTVVQERSGVVNPAPESGAGPLSAEVSAEPE